MWVVFIVSTKLNVDNRSSIFFLCKWMQFVYGQRKRMFYEEFRKAIKGCVRRTPRRSVVTVLVLVRWCADYTRFGLRSAMQWLAFGAHRPVSISVKAGRGAGSRGLCQSGMRDAGNTGRTRAAISTPLPRSGDTRVRSHIATATRIPVEIMSRRTR